MREYEAGLCGTVVDKKTIQELPSIFECLNEIESTIFNIERNQKESGDSLMGRNQEAICSNMNANEIPIVPSVNRRLYDVFQRLCDINSKSAMIREALR